ncbi:hypothetical protein TeGR_g2951 [Tetraparma gracilis]|uniref:EGF-like domain-containing protein n=1 Tax=Tetraparma gracilis TaxID=2962635 RepID=A0ABQ6N289_9STRA|nr:hypothetical protein TeGR_g2951 [Tetraparma gracilis]
MDPNPFCSEDACTEAEWGAGGKCCVEVPGDADCCATCNSGSSCSMVQHAGGASCNVRTTESGSFETQDWLPRRCEGAADGADGCFGDDGYCCEGGSDTPPGGDDDTELNCDEAACQAAGDVNSACVYGHHCICNVDEGFKCEGEDLVGVDTRVECEAGVLCVPIEEEEEVEEEEEEGGEEEEEEEEDVTTSSPTAAPAGDTEEEDEEESEDIIPDAAAFSAKPLLPFIALGLLPLLA